MRVVQRPVTGAIPGRGADGFSHIGPGPDDRVSKFHPPRQPGGDGGRKGTAGAVGVRRVDAGALEPLTPLGAYQNINQYIAFHMSAGYQRRTRAQGDKLPSGGFHVIDGFNITTGENPRLGHVGGDDCRQ